MLWSNRLRVLREVAAHGSFSAAAGELSYTPSAVSQQIAALEREVGATLVERHARGARLTDAGRALVRHTDAVLSQLASAQAEIESITRAETGSVHLATFASAWSTLTPLAAASFRTRHPDVRLTLSAAEPEAALAALRGGDLDMALIFEPNLAETGAYHGIDTVHLLEDELHAVLPRDHRFASRQRLRLRDLAGESWVQATKSCAELVARACREAGFEPEVAFESEDYQVIQGFVRGRRRRRADPAPRAGRQSPRRRARATCGAGPGAPRARGDAIGLPLASHPRTPRGRSRGHGPGRGGVTERVRRYQSGLRVSY